MSGTLVEKVEQYRQSMAAENPEIMDMPQEQVVSIMLQDARLNPTVKKALSSIYQDYEQRLKADNNWSPYGTPKQISIFPTDKEIKDDFFTGGSLHTKFLAYNPDEVEDAPLFGKRTKYDERRSVKKYADIVAEANARIDNAEQAVDAIYRESGWTGQTGEFLSKYNLFSPVRAAWNYFADDEQKSVITGESYGRTKGKYHWECTTSDSIKEEIAKVRQDVAALEEAAKKGDGSFKSAFYRLYGIEYDEKACRRYKIVKERYLKAAAIHAQKKEFDEKIQPFLDAPVQEDNGKYNEYVQTLAAMLPNGKEDIQTILQLASAQEASTSTKWQVLHDWAEKTKENIDTKLKESIQWVKSNATTIEECQDAYNRAYEKAFGNNNTFQRELERYSSLQSYRSGVTKLTLITAGTIASGGLGTAGAGAAGLGTTATAAVSTGAAGLGAAVTTGTVEATDQASAGKEIQWEEIAKASAVNGVITIAMGGTNCVLSNVMTKAGMGALTQAGTRMAANIGMGAGVEKIMTGEITKEGMAFVVTLSVVGEVMTVKSIKPKTTGGEIVSNVGQNAAAKVVATSVAEPAVTKAPLKPTAKPIAADTAAPKSQPQATDTAVPRTPNPESVKTKANTAQAKGQLPETPAAKAEPQVQAKSKVTEQKIDTKAMETEIAKYRQEIETARNGEAKANAEALKQKGRAEQADTRAKQAKTEMEKAKAAREAAEARANQTEQERIASEQRTKQLEAEKQALERQIKAETERASSAENQTAEAQKAAQEKIDGMQRRLNEINGKNGELAKANELLQQKIKTAEEANGRLTEANKNITAERDAAVKRADASDKEASRLKEQAEAAKRQAEAAERSAAKHKSKADTLERELNDTKTKSKTELEKAKLQEDAADARAKQAEQEQIAAEKRAEQLKSEKQALEKQIKAETERANAAENESAEVQKTSQEKIGKIEARLKAIEGEKGELARANETLKQKNAAFKEANQKLTETNSKLAAERDAALERAETADKQAADFEQKANEAKGRAELAERTAARHRAESDTTKKALKSAKDENVKLEVEKRASEVKTRQLEAENAAKQARVEQLEAEQKAFQEKIKSVESRAQVAANDSEAARKSSLELRALKQKAEANVKNLETARTELTKKVQSLENAKTALERTNKELSMKLKARTELSDETRVELNQRQSKFFEENPELAKDLEMSNPTWQEFKGPTGQKTAWKMHVWSVDQADYEMLAKEIIPYLKSKGVNFKTMSSVRSVEIHNGTNQSGKAFAIYPSSDAQMAEIAKGLDALIRQKGLTVRGSNIAGDRQMGKSGRLFYRYEYRSGKDAGLILDTNIEAQSDKYGNVYESNRGNNRYIAKDMKPTDDIWLKFDPSDPNSMPAPSKAAPTPETATKAKGVIIEDDGLTPIAEEADFVFPEANHVLSSDKPATEARPVEAPKPEVSAPESVEPPPKVKFSFKGKPQETTVVLEEPAPISGEIPPKVENPFRLAKPKAEPVKPTDRPVVSPETKAPAAVAENAPQQPKVSTPQPKPVLEQTPVKKTGSFKAEKSPVQKARENVASRKTALESNPENTTPKRKLRQAERRLKTALEKELKTKQEQIKALEEQKSLSHDEMQTLSKLSEEANNIRHEIAALEKTTSPAAATDGTNPEKAPASAKPEGSKLVRSQRKAMLKVDERRIAAKNEIKQLESQIEENPHNLEAKAKLGKAQKAYKKVLQDKIKRAEAQIKRLEKLKNPTPEEQARITSLRDEVIGLRTELGNLGEPVKVTLADHIEKVKAETARAREKVNESQRKVDAEPENKTLRKNLTEARKELKAKLEKELKLKQKQLKALEKQESRTESENSKIENLKNEIKALQSEIKGTNEAIGPGVVKRTVKGTAKAAGTAATLGAIAYGVQQYTKDDASSSDESTDASAESSSAPASSSTTPKDDSHVSSDSRSENNDEDWLSFDDEDKDDDKISFEDNDDSLSYSERMRGYTSSSLEKLEDMMNGIDLDKLSPETRNNLSSYNEFMQMLAMMYMRMQQQNLAIQGYMLQCFMNWQLGMTYAMIEYNNMLFANI